LPKKNIRQYSAILTFSERKRGGELKLDGWVGGGRLMIYLKSLNQHFIFSASMLSF